MPAKLATCAYYRLNSLTRTNATASVCAHSANYVTLNFLLTRAWDRDMKKLFQILFTRENLLAVLLCLILIALIIFTADTSPTWIYQGF